MLIVVWADNFWCELEEMFEFSHRSDDVMLVSVPEDVDDVDEWIKETRPQG